jgi:predicted glycosyltransferase
MGATGVERAVIVSLSRGAEDALLLIDRHPERVEGAVFLCPTVPLTPPPATQERFPFEGTLETDEGWAKQNRSYWLRDWRGYVEFFFSEMWSEPHSTKQIEDAVGWALETDAPTVLRGEAARFLDEEETRAICSRVRVPALVVQGDRDRIIRPDGGRELASALGCQLVTLEGSGHGPHARDPVRFNLLVRDFARAPVPASRWVRAAARPRRALYISSPIGLGHARRDLAIANELRTLHPDLEIDWLAQDPVTRVVEAAGERIHPASSQLASESRHIQSESSEHDLHCFQAIRRMDEILLANFMVFHDVVANDRYDLWIGDEAWDIDYYLHENPELKTAAYCWLTDFVGWLPMPDGGAHEAALTADYNAEMIEQIARYPRVRDRAIFVGNPDDIVPGTFGPGLPEIRAWTEQHYDFSGYITGFDQASIGNRAGLRAELGYGPDDRVCIVTVGGSGVGSALLRRVADAYDEARTLVPNLRMIVVTGPRIDTNTIPARPGLEVHAYVNDLYRHLAACDLAIVQGGLTTTMELAASQTPFLYFPLGHHFEQRFHVHHRLQRYNAGRALDYAGATPTTIAAAIAAEIGRTTSHRPVETDGAARAAAFIAGLL